MITEDVKEKTNNLVSDIEEFADTFYKLTSIRIVQKVTDITSASILTIVLFMSCVFAILFGGFALSWWLGDLMQSRIGGFLMGSVFFMLIMLGIYLSRKKLLLFLKNRLVRKFYE
jgi:hypothetical protein